ncbi:ABC transporter permease [Alcaligenaceae bacterium 429]|nr:ABC transporter permease [Alcaligenaceae bacterium 429]
MRHPTTWLQHTLYRLEPWILPLTLLLLWQWASTQQLWHSSLLVSPASVWQQLVDLFRTGQLQRAITASLTRELSGFFIGSLLGLALGITLGLSTRSRQLLGPSFNTFKQISLFAWIPLISVWFGLGDTAKVVFLSLAALVPVTVYTADGIQAVPLRLLEVARVYQYSTLQTIARVILPAALPAIFTGVYLALIYSWLATIGAEYLLVSGPGLGTILIEGSELFRMDLVLIGMTAIGLIGAGLNWSARLIERRLRLYFPQ